MLEIGTRMDNHKWSLEFLVYVCVCVHGVCTRKCVCMVYVHACTCSTLQVVFRKIALELVANLRKETCKIRHPMRLRLRVRVCRTFWQRLSILSYVFLL